MRSESPSSLSASQETCLYKQRCTPLKVGYLLCIIKDFLHSHINNNKSDSNSTTTANTTTIAYQNGLQDILADDPQLRRLQALQRELQGEQEDELQGGLQDKLQAELQAKLQGAYQDELQGEHQGKTKTQNVKWLCIDSPAGRPSSPAGPKQRQGQSKELRTDRARRRAPPLQ